MIEIGQNLASVLGVVAIVALILGLAHVDKSPSKGSRKAQDRTEAKPKVSTLPRTTICAMCGHRQPLHDPGNPVNPERKQCAKCGIPFIWSWPVIPSDADVRGPGAPEA